MRGRGSLQSDVELEEENVAILDGVLFAFGAEESGFFDRLLGLITYFTSGVQEVRAWTIKRGTKAPGAAGVIHSDFERGFIKADAYHCEDLFTYGSEQAVKEKGLLKSEGKEYVVRDGDILFFKFNV